MRGVAVGLNVEEAFTDIAFTLATAGVEAVAVRPFLLPQSQLLGRVRSSAPDIKLLAEEMARRMVASGVPTRRKLTVQTGGSSGNVFVGLSGDFRGGIAPELLRRTPIVNKMRWGVLDCAEPKAFNKALQAGEKVEELYQYTIDLKTLKPVKRCPNCKVTTKGVITLSD